MRGRNRPKQRSRFYWIAATICIIVVAFVGGWFVFGASGNIQPQLDIEERYSRGVIAQALGDFEEAQRAFQEVIALDPAYKDAASRLIAVGAQLAVVASGGGGAPDTPTSASGVESASHVAATQTAEAGMLATASAGAQTAQAAERETADMVNTAIAATLTARPTFTFQPTHTPAPTQTPVATPTRTPTPDTAATAIALHGPQTISWVAIPAGEFIMGSSDEEIWAAVEFCNQSEGNCQYGWFDDELPRRAVSTEGYQISRYEITNAQYNVCVLVGVCPQAGRMVSDTNIPYDPIFFADDYPVVAVSKDDAAAYCAWAGGRLPSEVEWEKAARGTDGYIYPWGSDFGWDALQIWTTGPAPVGSHPVGASLYGVHDMAGNAFEWTASAEGGNYVARGGGWHSYPFRARAADRGTKLPASFVNYDIGFRCVR